MGIVTQQEPGDDGTRTTALWARSIFCGARDVGRHHGAQAGTRTGDRGFDTARTPRPRGTVFIGDSPYDCQAGKAAGVSTAAALWGPFSREPLEPHAPDFWLERPEQILEIACARAEG